MTELANPWRTSDNQPDHNVYTFAPNVRMAGMVTRAELNGLVRAELERLVDTGTAELERVDPAVQ